MDNEGLVKLLFEALKFYAEQANYDNNQIIKDRGHQARFVIDLVNKNNETLKSMEKQFDEFNKQIEENFSETDALNIINELTNITKQK